MSVVNVVVDTCVLCLNVVELYLVQQISFTYECCALSLQTMFVGYKCINVTIDT